jgi:hypothetical protein
MDWKGNQLATVDCPEDARPNGAASGVATSTSRAPHQKQKKIQIQFQFHSNRTLSGEKLFPKSRHSFREMRWAAAIKRRK